jgi:hypothetical protein
MRHDVLRIIYNGAILPLLSYGAPVWIECLKKKHNAVKRRRVQRLKNMKMASASRTTSNEALCVLTGMTPIFIELESQTNIYYNTRGHKKSELYDAPKHYSQWNHPADAVETKEKERDKNTSRGLYRRQQKSRRSRSRHCNIQEESLVASTDV